MLSLAVQWVFSMGKNKLPDDSYIFDAIVIMLVRFETTVYVTAFLLAKADSLALLFTSWIFLRLKRAINYLNLQRRCSNYKSFKISNVWLVSCVA